MYLVTPYYMTKVMIEMPVYILIPLINLLVVFFGIGVHVTAANFFIFYLSQFLIAMSASSWGYLIATLIPNSSIAVELAPIILIPIVLFGGLIVNLEASPKWISWL